MALFLYEILWNSKQILLLKNVWGKKTKNPFEGALTQTDLLKKVVRMAVRVDPHPPLIYTAIIFWKS